MKLRILILTKVRTFVIVVFARPVSLSIISLELDSVKSRIILKISTIFTRKLLNGVKIRTSKYFLHILQKYRTPVDFDLSLWITIEWLQIRQFWSYNISSSLRTSKADSLVSELVFKCE